MVRIGKRVDTDSIQAFDASTFSQSFYVLIKGNWNDCRRNYESKCSYIASKRYNRNSNPNDTHERHSAHSIVDQNNHVVGIISDRDVRDASPSILDEQVSIDMLQQPLRTYYETSCYDLPSSRFR